HRRRPQARAEQRRTRGAAAPSPRESPAQARQRHAQASNGFLRSGDPVMVQPFIEAEEATGHGAKRACRLLEVSRSAYSERKQAVPSPRALSDAEMTEKITAIHTESDGTYGSPRMHRELRKRGETAGRRRVRRLMREAGLQGHAKKRWRKTTVPDPDAQAAKDLIQRHFGPCTELDRRYVGDITYIATWEGWA